MTTLTARLGPVTTDRGPSTQPTTASQFSKKPSAACRSTLRNARVFALALRSRDHYAGSVLARTEGGVDSFFLAQATRVNAVMLEKINHTSR